MTSRPLTILSVLATCGVSLALSTCGRPPCPVWQPPLVVALPHLTSQGPASAGAAEPRRCTDWKEVRGGPRRTGRSYCPGLRRPPEIHWRFDTGAPVVASPLVKGRWVYVGSTNGRLFALDRATGKRRWSFDAGSAIRAAVALGRSTVYLATMDGQLRSLDAVSGRVRWTHQGRHRITHAPMVIGNQVLVGTSDGRLTALDGRTGMYRWQFVTASAWHPSRKGGYTLAGIGGPPARAADTLYFGSLGGQVHALAATTGQLRWGIQTGWAVRSPPVVTPRGLWVSDSSGYLHMLSVINGDRQGRGMRSWYDKNISAPTLGDHGLYLTTPRTLMALAHTGHVRWKHNLGWSTRLMPRRLRPAPVLAGDVVYLNDPYGRLLALDAKGGQLLWHRRARRGAFSAPAPLREGLVIGSGDGHVYLLAADE